MKGKFIDISPSVFAYSIFKGAINTLTRTLAQQLSALGITVNAILTGIINTEMNAETLGIEMDRNMLQIYRLLIGGENLRI